MRRSFDGLHALVRDHLPLDPFAGHLYLFANRRKDRLKILYWDRSGFAIWAKRLEAGSEIQIDKQSFQASFGNKEAPTHAVLKRSGTWLVGKVTWKNSAFDAHLFRSPEISAQSMRTYEGLYEAANETLVIERYWDWLTVTNLSSSLVRFVAGPSLFATVPIGIEIAFQRKDDAEIKSADWNENGVTLRFLRIPLRREAVTFTNGSIKLSGDLIIPSGNGPHPAIVYLHGSGPVPRNTFFGLGYRQAQLGFAVLSFDKRGVGESGGKWWQTTFEDLAGDAVAGARFLASRPDIAPGKIGFWGISQGGWLTTIAANRFKETAFAISVSGGIRSPEVTELEDSEAELRGSGKFTPEEIAQAIRFQKLKNRYMRSREGWDDYITARKAAITASWYGYPTTDLSGPATENDPSWKWDGLNYFYDPQPEVERLACPALFVFPATNSSATDATYAKVIEAEAAKSGNGRVTVLVLSRTNHNMWLADTANMDTLTRITRFNTRFFELNDRWLALLPVLSPNSSGTVLLLFANPGGIDSQTVTTAEILSGSALHVIPPFPLSRSVAGSQAV